MLLVHCPDCGVIRSFRRGFGRGTFFALRCTVCGKRLPSRRGDSGEAPTSSTAKRPWSWLRDGLILVILLAAIIVVAMLAYQTRAR